MNSIYSRGPQCGTVDNSYEIGKQTLVGYLPSYLAPQSGKTGNKVESTSPF